MAQFRATIKGQRGEASRLGSKKSGIYSNLNAWNIGLRVYLTHNETTGKDEIDVTLTGGSNGARLPKHLGTFSEE